MIRDYDDHVRRFGDSHAPMFIGDHNDLIDDELIGSYFVRHITCFSTNNILCILLHVYMRHLSLIPRIYGVEGESTLAYA